jgi:hypothetical protein
MSRLMHAAMGACADTLIKHFLQTRCDAEVVSMPKQIVHASTHVQMRVLLQHLPLGPACEYGERARHLIGLDHQGLINT